jgi:hypothetical protein
MINTALWNTIQLLFKEAASAPPTPPPNYTHPLQPCQRSSSVLSQGGARANSSQRGVGPTHPILTNPFRPAWQQRQEIQVLWT